MFVSIYFLLYFYLYFLRIEKIFFDYPKTNKKYSISVLVPAWNEEKNY